MSYLSIVLQRQTERRQFNQSDLARGSGLSKSHISRLFSGESHELSDENFVAMLKVFSADPQAQAEVIAARCRDTLAGAAGTTGASLVEISVKGEPSKPHRSFENLAPQLQLAQETEHAFAWLRSQCPLNPDLEAHLVGYARLMGMK